MSLLFPDTIRLLDNLLQCLIQSISQENIALMINQFLFEYSTVQYIRVTSEYHDLEQCFYILSDQLFIYNNYPFELKKQIWTCVFKDFNVSLFSFSLCLE